MYGLPSDFDPRMFLGRQLLSLTFAVNLIGLAFDEGVNVTVLGSVAYRHSLQSTVSIDSPPVTRTTLVRLVGDVVVASEARSRRELILRFERGGSVTLLDDSDEYESYVINEGDREIIV